jgi:hypothetical protein
MRGGRAVEALRKQQQELLKQQLLEEQQLQLQENYENHKLLQLKRRSLSAPGLRLDRNNNDFDSAYPTAFYSYQDDGFGIGDTTDIICVTIDGDSLSERGGSSRPNTSSQAVPKLRPRTGDPALKRPHSSNVFTGSDPVGNAKPIANIWGSSNRRDGTVQEREDYLLRKNMRQLIRASTATRRDSDGSAKSAQSRRLSMRPRDGLAGWSNDDDFTSVGDGSDEDALGSFFRDDSEDSDGIDGGAADSASPTHASKTSSKGSKKDQDVNRDNDVNPASDKRTTPSYSGALSTGIADRAKEFAPSGAQSAPQESRKGQLNNLQKFVGEHTTRKLVAVWNLLEVRKLHFFYFAF